MELYNVHWQTPTFKLSDFPDPTECYDGISA